MEVLLVGIWALLVFVQLQLSRLVRWVERRTFGEAPESMQLPVAAERVPPFKEQLPLACEHPPLLSSRLLHTTHRKLPEFRSMMPSTSSSGRYYVVRRGFRPGIYTSWSECKENVSGYKGAIHKSFRSIEDAERYYRVKWKNELSNVNT